MGDKLCYIGPLQLDQAHLVDNDTFTNSRDISLKGTMYTLGKLDPSEGFIICGTNEEIKQLIGLCQWDDVFWLDTSIELEDGKDFKHKGWYLISADNLDFLGPDYAQLKINSKLISRNEQDYFEQDYVQIDQLPYDYVITPTPPGGVPGVVTESYYNVYLDSSSNMWLNTTLYSVAKQPTSAWVDTSGGNVGWSYVASLCGSGTAQAKNGSSTCYNTHKLAGNGFGFAIPTNTIVTGVVLTIRYANSTPSSSGCQKVHAVQIDGNAGYYALLNQAYSAGTNTNSMKTWTLGSSSNLLGLSSSPSAYNAGVNMRYWATVAPDWVSYIDYFIMTLYYRNHIGTYTRNQTISTNKTAWGNLSFTASIPSGTSIIWNIYSASDNALLSTYTSTANSNTVNLSTLPHVNLKLVATFTEYNGTSPSLSTITLGES